jgi:hypothetical protein
MAAIVIRSCGLSSKSCENRAGGEFLAAEAALADLMVIAESIGEKG